MCDATAASALIESGVLEPLVHDVSEQNYPVFVAKRAVENGTYVAAIIIPPDFTERIAYIPMFHPSIEETGITVYANSGSSISASVIPTWGILSSIAVAEKPRIILKNSQIQFHRIIMTV